MKAYSIAIAALAVLLSILLSTWLNSAKVEGRPVTRVQSSSTSSRASSSQSLADLPAKKKDAYKQVDSSFRRIPPSTSNPIQNKRIKPPSVGQESRRQQKAKSIEH